MHFWTGRPTFDNPVWCARPSRKRVREMYPLVCTSDLCKDISIGGNLKPTYAVLSIAKGEVGFVNWNPSTNYLGAKIYQGS